MSKGSDRDEDLIVAFEQLKAGDRLNAPRFIVPVRARKSWPMRVGLATTGIAAIAAALVILFVLNPNDGDSVVESPIAFDEISEMISRELGAASVSEWESPTDFLLNP